MFSHQLTYLSATPVNTHQCKHTHTSTDHAGVSPRSVGHHGPRTTTTTTTTPPPPPLPPHTGWFGGEIKIFAPSNFSFKTHAKLMCCQSSAGNYFHRRPCPSASSFVSLLITLLHTTTGIIQYNII